MMSLRLYLLGAPRVELNGVSPAMDTRKALALLAYLAVTGQSHSRDSLAALLWPEYSQSQARANLRRTLSTLSKAIGSTWLDVERESIGLNGQPGLWVDANEFQTQCHLLRPGSLSAPPTGSELLPQLSQAADLYNGDFMAGFSLRDSPDFEEWQFLQAEHLRRQFIDLLQYLVEGCLAGGDFEQAKSYAYRWANLDPLDEVAQRYLMQLYAQTNQRNAALRQYQTLVRVLKKELGVSPDQETESLYRAIEAGRLISPARSSPEAKEQEGRAAPEKDHSAPLEISQPTSPPRLRPHSGPPFQPSSNLPAPTTPLIGRESELKELIRLLTDPPCRLVTLTGLGGIGKTRLAIETATALANHFSDGVWFVPLAAVTGVEFLPVTLADTLSIGLHGTTSPAIQLGHALRPKHMLLVLDNLEQLLTPAASAERLAQLLSDLLSGAPGLKLLATSRERLNLQGEWLVEVEGLPFPPVEAETEPVETSYESVTLFIQSARRRQPGWTLSPEQAPAAAKICQLVRGVPLGLELAAAWTRLLSCVEIVQEIERNVDFLKASDRDLPARHRSLRAIFEHSWQMLSTQEREIFAKLSLFRGGFGRETAQDVVGASLAGLAGLVDKSLLRLTPDGRFELHELLRQYAAEKLWLETLALEEHVASAGRTNPARTLWQRYSSHYLRLVSRYETALRGNDAPQAIAALRLELDNLRQAWEWAVHEREFDLVEISLGGLSRFYDLTNLFQEGESLFEQATVQATAALATSQAEAERPRLSRVIAHLKVEQARLLTRRGLTEAAYELAQQAVDLAAGATDMGLEALAAHQLGEVLNFQGKYKVAQGHLEQAWALARQAGRVDIEREAQRDLGISFLCQSDYTQAEQYLTEALARFYEVGDRRGVMVSLLNLGNTAYYRSAFEVAQQRFEAAVKVAQEMGDRWGEFLTQANLGFLELELGQRAQAQARLEALIATSFGQEFHIFPHIWHTLGNLYRDQGDLPAAEKAYTEGLELARTSGDRSPETMILADWSLLCHYRRDNDQALFYARQAQALAEELGMLPELALAWTHAGHALAALAHPLEAGEAYRQALSLRRQLEQPGQTLAALAGLAQLALDQGDLNAAVQTVADILPHFEQSVPQGASEPFRALLVCVRVLQAAGDPQAADLAAQAGEWLQQRAAPLAEASRPAFVENIPCHRALAALNREPPRGSTAARLEAGDA